MTKTTIPAGKLRHILLWSIAMLYFWFSPSLYYHLFPREGKPIEVWEAPPEANGDIFYNIEGLTYWSKNMVVYEAGETHALGGWAFLNMGPDIQQDEFDRFIVVYDKGHAYIFPVQIYSRPGVQDAFKDLGLSDLTSSGFNVVISRNALTPGEYSIGILFKHKQNGSTYFIQTNKLVERTPNSLSLKPQE